MKAFRVLLTCALFLLFSSAAFESVAAEVPEDVPGVDCVSVQLKTDFRVPVGIASYLDCNREGVSSNMYYPNVTCDGFRSLVYLSENILQSIVRNT